MQPPENNEAKELQEIIAELGGQLDPDNRTGSLCPRLNALLLGAVLCEIS